ncbi:hypothetical protein [Mesoflavibacter zeaxanthinifaciens]|uniref:hypothetical protein n=1 Tax=Mesoflavibacter zeaxanthinifaciens TaxID=393060 RepID=UPI003A944F8A
MKKLYLILLTVFLNSAFFSCTPQALNEATTASEQATDCCGDDGELPPPPPPPPPGDGG